MFPQSVVMTRFDNVLGQIHNIDIKLLRIFHTIVKCGGFSLAQAQLNLSQSAISTYMSQLEIRLGMRLCERGHGVFKLTDEGRAVLVATEKLFSALESFQNEVTESQNKLLGELRIGFIDNSVTHPDGRICKAIRNFIERAPDAHIKVYIGGAIELEEQVMDGSLQLAIGLFHHRLPSLEYSFLFEEEHLLYCGYEHPFYSCSDSELTPDIIANANYVSWDYVESLPGWEPPFSFHDVASSPYIEGIAFLILSGRYVAFLPTHYAGFWTEKNQMRPILPEKTRRTTPFHLITNKSTSKSQLCRTFLEALGNLSSIPGDHKVQ